MSFNKKEYQAEYRKKNAEKMKLYQQKYNKKKKYRGMTVHEYLEFINSRIRYAKRDLSKLTRKIELYEQQRIDAINIINKKLN